MCTKNELGFSLFVIYNLAEKWNKTPPDVIYSKDYLDFGKGFYVTTYREQAEKWALRKGIRNFRGMWSKKRALAELRYYKMNNQICIVNQAVLAQMQA